MKKFTLTAVTVALLALVDTFTYKFAKFNIAKGFVSMSLLKTVSIQDLPSYWFGMAVIWFILTQRYFKLFHLNILQSLHCSQIFLAICLSCYSLFEGAGLNAMMISACLLMTTYITVLIFQEEDYASSIKYLGIYLIMQNLGQIIAALTANYPFLLQYMPLEICVALLCLSIWNLVYRTKTIQPKDLFIAILLLLLSLLALICLMYYPYITLTILCISCALELLLPKILNGATMTSSFNFKLVVENLLCVLLATLTLSNLDTVDLSSIVRYSKSILWHITINPITIGDFNSLTNIPLVCVLMWIMFHYSNEFYNGSYKLISYWALSTLIYLSVACSYSIRYVTFAYHLGNINLWPLLMIFSSLTYIGLKAKILLLKQHAQDLLTLIYAFNALINIYLVFVDHSIMMPEFSRGLINLQMHNMLLILFSLAVWIWLTYMSFIQKQ